MQTYLSPHDRSNSTDLLDIFQHAITVVCKQQFRITALTFAIQGNQKVVYPSLVGSQPIKPYKKPAKDTQVKPDAVRWKM